MLIMLKAILILYGVINNLNVYVISGEKGSSVIIVDKNDYIKQVNP